MASSAAASTLSRSMPPTPTSSFVFQSAPRVRPPPMPPGTKSPNTDPQPPGPVPKGRVWVQGAWRNKASPAGKQERKVLSARVERAVRARTHGQSIYAYTHIRTKQVVYSLTKILQNNKILRQLVFHGKKTVPANVRRDMWVPYFSIHFPDSPGGRGAGLLAYRRLRELSLRRQLEGPDELVRATEEDVETAKKRYGPLRLAELEEEGKLESRLPRVGKLLSKKGRARKLMDQKATSVADVAMVLGLQDEDGWDLDALQMDRGHRREERLKETSRKFRKRLRIIRSQEEDFKQKQEKKAQMVTKEGRESGQIGIQGASARRIALGQDGFLRGRDEVVLASNSEDGLSPFDAKVVEVRRLLEQDRVQVSEDQAADVQPGATEVHEPTPSTGPVKILWADLEDRNHADQWPVAIEHGQLDRQAVLRDTYGRWIGGTVHSMANEQKERFETSMERRERREEERKSKMEEHEKQERVVRMEMARDIHEKALQIDLEFQESLRRIDGARETSTTHNPGSESVLTTESKEQQRLRDQYQQLLGELSSMDKDKWSDQPDAKYAEFAGVRDYVENRLWDRLARTQDESARMIRLVPVLELKRLIEGGPKQTQRARVGSLLGQSGTNAKHNIAENKDGAEEVDRVDLEANQHSDPLQELYREYPELREAAKQIATYLDHNAKRESKVRSLRRRFKGDRETAVEALKARIAELRERNGNDVVPRDVEKFLIRETLQEGKQEMEEAVGRLRAAACEDRAAMLEIYSALLMGVDTNFIAARRTTMLESYDARLDSTTTTGGESDKDDNVVRLEEPRGWLAPLGRTIARWFGRGG